MCVRNDVGYTISFNTLNHRLVTFSFTFNCTQQLVPRCTHGKINGLKFVDFKLRLVWIFFFFLLENIHVYMTPNNGLILFRSLKESNNLGLKILCKLFFFSIK